jgi:ElaB/YqjD/DUF883 family membrane-anchored ribosome-binding protein
MSTKTDEREKSASDYLEDAIKDLDRARHDVADDMRSMIDSVIDRSREVLDQMRSDAGDRAERLKERAEHRLSEWQSTLDEASEDLRHELGVRAVRAQHTEDALETLSDEIDNRKKELQNA